MTNSRPILIAVALLLIGCRPPVWGPTNYLVVNSFDIPRYDPLAAIKKIEGDVRIKAVTNGSVVVETKLENGSIDLARAAINNLMTWKFTQHDPITFIVVYKYRLTGKRLAAADAPVTVILRMPFEVEVIRNGQ